MYSKLASAIYNDIYAGLKGMHANNSISMELIEDEIVSVRLLIFKELQAAGRLSLKEMMLAINCVPVDCQYLERCPVCRDGGETPNLHFEIPQIVTEFGDAAIAYLGSTDRQKEFDVYMTSNYTNKYHAYRKRGKRNPYVYIDPVPNKNNMFDGWVFNAPFLKTLSIVAVFKDMRLLEHYSCCEDLTFMENFSWIDNMVKDKIVAQKLQFYRQYSPAPQPNDQAYK